LLSGGTAGTMRTGAVMTAEELTIARATYAADAAAVRERVLANIAETRAGNASSNFGTFVQSEGKVQESLGIWPPNSGGYATVYDVKLPVGTAIDRYGFPGGSFVSPTGTPFADRALPSTYLVSKPYFQYEVAQEISGVTQAKALPWFGQRGMGTQYQLPNSVQWYLENGYLKPAGK
jgi:filamentous hemagglutinin